LIIKLRLNLLSRRLRALKVLWKGRIVLDLLRYKVWLMQDINSLRLPLSEYWAVYLFYGLKEVFKLAEQLLLVPLQALLEYFV
jgi:hypothetical protein